jgi:hypothetical protein
MRDRPMATELQASQKSLYETDFVRWVETTVEQLLAPQKTGCTPLKQLTLDRPDKSPPQLP